jgi:hypothetical protein
MRVCAAAVPYVLVLNAGPGHGDTVRQSIAGCIKVYGPDAAAP